MREFSRFLREARESKGMSLQQVHEATKIRLCYLEAIESGDFDTIPGPVYVRGFLRSYASCIGSNPSDVLAEYDKARASQTPAAAGEPVRRIEPSRTLRSRKPVPRLKWGYFALGAALIISALGLAWLFSHSRVPGQPASQAGSGSLTPAIHGDGVTTVALEVIASCWTEARVDGKVAFSGTLSPGDSTSWTGKSIQVILGNAAGVVLTVDGEKRETSGAVGERVELTFGNDSP